jgi:hypothetical protein
LSTPQKLGNAPVAESAVLASKVNDIRCQPLLITTPARYFALRRAVLSEDPANTALGHIQRLPDMGDTRPAARRARGFPLEAS